MVGHNPLGPFTRHTPGGDVTFNDVLSRRRDRPLLPVSLTDCERSHYRDGPVHPVPTVDPSSSTFEYGTATSRPIPPDFAVRSIVKIGARTVAPTSIRLSGSPMVVLSPCMHRTAVPFSEGSHSSVFYESRTSLPININPLGATIIPPLPVTVSLSPKPVLGVPQYWYLLKPTE